MLHGRVFVMYIYIYNWIIIKLFKTKKHIPIKQHKLE